MVIGLGVTFFGGDCCWVTGALSKGGRATGFLGEGVFKDEGVRLGVLGSTTCVCGGSGTVAGVFEDTGKGAGIVT